MIILSKDEETIYEFGVGCMIFMSKKDEDDYEILACGAGDNHNYVRLGEYDKSDSKNIIQSIYCSLRMGNKSYYMPIE